MPLAIRCLVVSLFVVLATAAPAAGFPADNPVTKNAARVANSIDAVVPPDIPRDCSADVTERLQAWIDAQPDGTPDDPQVLWFGGGCFGLGSAVAGTRGAAGNLGPRNGLLLIERRHLELRGSAQFRALVDAPIGDDGNHINRALLWLENSQGITVGGRDTNRDGLVGPRERLRFAGTNLLGTYDPLAGHEHDHGVRIMGGSDVVVEDVDIRRTWGDSVYVSPGPNNSGAGPVPWGAGGIGALPARRITVRTSVLATSGRHNLACVGCDGLTVWRNTMSAAGYWVVDLEQQLPAAPIRGVLISQNRATIARYGFVAASSIAGTDGGVADIEIAANVFTGSQTCYEFVHLNGGAAGAGPPTMSRITVRDNRMNMNQYGISARNVTGLTATGNRGVARTRLNCSATGSTTAPRKLFAFLAIRDGVSEVTATNNSYLRRTTDLPTVQTASVVEVVGTVQPAQQVDNCSNRTTASLRRAYDQPVVCG